MTSVFDPELLSAEVRKETPTDTIVRKYVLEKAQDKTVLLKLERETVRMLSTRRKRVLRMNIIIMVK